MNPNEVFLSHASPDRAIADRIAAILTEHGVPVWYSIRDILGAQQWHDEIAAALSRCDWFIVLLSPDSVSSMWVKRELLYALQQPRFENRIVPLLIADCLPDKLSWTLSLFQMVSLIPSFDDGCRELLRVWGIGFHPRAVAP